MGRLYGEIRAAGLVRARSAAARRREAGELGARNRNSIKGEHGYIVARFATEDGLKFIPYRGNRMLSHSAMDSAREAMEVCERNYLITGGAD